MIAVTATIIKLSTTIITTIINNVEIKIQAISF